jgi:hypothetical protein
MIPISAVVKIAVSKSSKSSKMIVVHKKSVGPGSGAIKVHFPFQLGKHKTVFSLMI